jgi:hypothetical protein
MGPLTNSNMNDLPGLDLRCNEAGLDFGNYPSQLMEKPTAELCGHLHLVQQLATDSSGIL